MSWKINNKEREVHCSLVKEAIVYIEPIPKGKIELLMDKYPNQEWLGSLVGRIDEQNFFVEDLSIPPHTEVSMASAEVEPFHIPDRCIGVIHSHDSMGAFHSGVDNDHVDKNFDVSVTVAKKTNMLEFDTVSSQVTPCGRRTTVKGKVKFVKPEPMFDTKAFLKEATANIDKGSNKFLQVQDPWGRLPNNQKFLETEAQFNNLNRQRGYVPRKNWFTGQPNNPPVYPPYIPPENEKYYVGEGGRVMYQKELDEHLREIWGKEGTP